MGKGISKQLKNIIDKSFDEYKFPDIWKTAKVFPVFKSGNKEEMDNYRPISILCAVSIEKQFVINNNSTSDMNITTYGIPQGSILGPLLFLIYINDLSLNIPDTKVNMYADDTTIYVNDEDVVSIESRLKSQLEKLCTWCYDTGFIINYNKSNSMLLCTSQKSHYLDKQTLELLLQNISLSSVKEQKVLGITIDDRLTFETHIKNTCSKISCLSGMLWRIRDYIPHETKILYYNSYVLPLLDYCVNVWGHTSQTHLDCIYRLQKRIVRIISNACFWVFFLTSVYANCILILFHRF